MRSRLRCRARVDLFRGSLSSTPSLSNQELLELEDQITELAAHIHAANYRLLTLIRQYDEQDGWAGPGLRSCAHWLNWKVGIGMNAAREKVRVAHALAELPKISDAFSAGKISYSKVRAMTRVATPNNEHFLLRIALHGTASHVEKAVSQFKRSRRDESLTAENQRHECRKVVWSRDDDGSWRLYARFAPEQGERIMKAVEAAMDEIEAEQENVSAETSREPDLDQPMPDRFEQRRADALERLADSFLSGQGASVNGGETKLRNLVTLCRHHHRAIHEGGFQVRVNSNSQPEFRDPNGKVIPTAPETRYRGNVFSLINTNRRQGLAVSAETCIPEWCGERMDSDMVVAKLLELQFPE